jgi:adenosylcobinamide-phosphate synthase
MNRAALLLAILLFEAAVGYPRRWPHPVQAAGMLIGTFERRFNRGSDKRRRIAGTLLLLLLVAISVLAGAAISIGAGTGAGVLLVVVIGSTGLAQRSLYGHVAAVRDPLLAGDLEQARQAVGRVVGRDTAPLDQGGVATAAIETLGESFCDGVVAPAFWFLVGGLPGLFAAKAINTADSMIGHLTERLGAFGWASARADDLVNWIPARIAGVLLCLSGWGGWATMVRDARKHSSPNGGWPEAALAGALGRRLGGGVSYEGELVERGILGCGSAPGAADVARALRIYRGACLLLWLLVGVAAWAL